MNNLKPDPLAFFDLSHTIEHGMITYRGLPAPIICDFLSREASRARYAEGTEFQIGRIDMVANTGTYLDSPCFACARRINGNEAGRCRTSRTMRVYPCTRDCRRRYCHRLRTRTQKASWRAWVSRNADILSPASRGNGSGSRYPGRISHNEIRRSAWLIITASRQTSSPDSWS